MVGSAGRLARAMAGTGSMRTPVDGIEGASAAPARDQAAFYDAYDAYDRRGAVSPVRRYGTMHDGVIGFGSVLVSQEVGAAIMYAQAQYGAAVAKPVEAERQIANYEFAQSLMGPPEVMVQSTPLQQQALQSSS